jgi:hypothetical protein
VNAVFAKIQRHIRYSYSSVDLSTLGVRTIYNKRKDKDAVQSPRPCFTLSYHKAGVRCAHRGFSNTKLNTCFFPCGGSHTLGSIINDVQDANCGEILGRDDQGGSETK